MLIAIDGNEANIKNRVGSNVYAHKLLLAIYQLRTSNEKLSGYKFRIYLKNKPIADLPKKTDWWQYRVIKSAKLWTQWRLPLDLYFYQPRPDVFFTPGHYLPRFSPCPLVMAIMDLSYIYFPQMFKKKDLWQLKNWTAYSVKKAKKILTISQSSKNDIINYYCLKKDKIIVIYPGMKSNPQSAIGNFKKKYGIKGNYILYVGTLQPRKNLICLIKAFKQVIDNKKPAPLAGRQVTKDLSLVIVGKKGWLYKEIFEQVKSLGLEKRVIFTGYIDDNDLALFYQNALCFVLVSLYEGFGFPVLEAMKYGCPVVASNTSSLPEIVGKAGVLVNPKNSKEIAQGIEKAIKNRQELVKKGLSQVKKFSWQKTAKEVLRVLKGL